MYDTLRFTERGATPVVPCSAGHSALVPPPATGAAQRRCSGPDSAPIDTCAHASWRLDARRFHALRSSQQIDATAGAQGGWRVLSTNVVERAQRRQLHQTPAACAAAARTAASVTAATKRACGAARKVAADERGAAGGAARMQQQRAASAVDRPARESSRGAGRHLRIFHWRANVAALR